MNGDKKREIQELLANNPRGYTINEISDKVGITRQTTSKYLEILKAEDKVEVREVGRAKIHYLQQENLETFAEGNS